MGEHGEPSGAGKIVVAAIIGIVVGALVAGGLVLVLQNGKIKDKEDALAAAQAQQVSAAKQVQDLTGKVSGLQKQLGKTQSQLNNSQTQQQQTQAQVEQLTGPSLPDGRYIAAIKMVDTGSTPPKITFDVEQWFSGNAANQAAAQDGQPTPVPNDYYVRNESTQLRTFPVDPAAPISIVFKAGGQSVPLSQFAAIYDGTAFWQKAVQKSLYWLTVSNGTVTKIEAQFVP